MKEEWRDVKGYEGYYQVSNLGEVKSIDRTIVRKDGQTRRYKGRILKQTKNSHGYKVVGLSKRAKTKNVYVHLLVAIRFLNHSPCGHVLVVDHVDGIKTNNVLTNLRIITNRENTSLRRKNKYTNLTGVTFNKNRNKWVSQILLNGKRLFLGHFSTDIAAKEAYDNKLNTN